ncbi:hypothetical protein ES705_39556 [subsurface metagenome]
MKIATFPATITIGSSCNVSLTVNVMVKFVPTLAIVGFTVKLEIVGSVKSNVTVVFPKPVFPTKSVAETLTVLFPSPSVPCTV